MEAVQEGLVPRDLLPGVLTCSAKGEGFLTR